MVELTRAIAMDAGESGQILEESDLSDSAVAERLREDLRTRVLATRLLRKYGYLLPKVNPESDLAQEQRLVFQERAQELARAAERNYQPREHTPAEQFANCSAPQSDCELPERSLQRMRTSSKGDIGEALPAIQTPEQTERPVQSTRPGTLRTEAPETGSFETVLATSTQGYSGGASSLGNQRSSGRTQERACSPALNSNEGMGNPNPASDAALNSSAPRSTSHDYDRRSPHPQRVRRFMFALMRVAMWACP